MKLGLPKGRFEAASRRVVEAFGTPAANKSLSFQTEGPFRQIYLLRVQDIAPLVSSGQLDCGLAPDEWVLEHCSKDGDSGTGKTLKVLGNAAPITTRLSFFSRKETTWPPPSGSIVATSFPNIVSKYGVEKSILLVPLPMSGSVEAVVPSLAEWGFDCVETGATLKENDLHEIHTAFNNLHLSLVSGVDIPCKDPVAVSTLLDIFGAL